MSTFFSDILKLYYNFALCVKIFFEKTHFAVYITIIIAAVVGNVKDFFYSGWLMVAVGG